MTEKDIINAELSDKKSCEFDEVLKTMHDMGMKCGREISLLAKKIHPDCIAVVQLYRSCIVITQTEEENKEGICTIHAYADPHWLGNDINEETLISDDFHFKFQVHGQRSGPELIFNKKDKCVRMPINQGFDLIEIAEKGLDKMFENLGLEENDDSK